MEKAAAAAARAAQQISAVGVARSARTFIVKVERMLLVNAQPVTWTRNGRQYVTILSGIGGTTSQRRGLPLTALGGSVWTFALMPE